MVSVVGCVHHAAVVGTDGNVHRDSDRHARPVVDADAERNARSAAVDAAAPSSS